MRCRLTLQAVAAAAAFLIDAASAFSFTSQPSKQGIRSNQLFMQWNDGDDEAHIIKSRREFFSKVAAAAPILLTATQASAVTNEPTRIELSVDTEYLIRVLNYFDGDFRKVLGVLVRSPQTTVEIEPPAKGNDPNLTPEDAILRALYSYSSPDDYVTQASWLKVDEPDKGWVQFLMKKRYQIQLPSIGSDGGESNGSAEVVIRPTTVKLSNLEAGVGLGVLSYPAAYSYYNYESYREEQEKKAKKAKMAAKKAAKAKTTAAKKAKGTPKKEQVEAKSEEVTKQPRAMKGQEMKKDGVVSNIPLSMKKVTKGTKTMKPPKDIATKSMASMEDKVAAQMLDSQRENFIAATEQQQQSDSLGTPPESPQEETQYSELEQYIAAAEKQWSEASQLETQPSQDFNELEQLVAAAARNVKTSESSQSATGGGYLDTLSQESQFDKPSLSQPAGATGYLDDISLNFSESAQSTTAIPEENSQSRDGIDGGMNTYDAQMAAFAGRSDGSRSDADEESTEPRTMGTSLRALVENVKPKRGPLNNYLDSL